MALALITGGSKGIGAALADRLASRGHDLLFVARDPERVHADARALARRYAVRADVLAADLATRHGLLRVEALLSGPAAPAVDVLVHDAAAGIAGTPGFLLTLEQQQARIDLGVTAPMRLTHAVLPGMLRRGSGIVITVGIAPLPSEDPSTAWAVSFTGALAATLGGTGVRAVAVRTEERARWTAHAADVVLGDAAAGRTVSTPGTERTALLDRAVATVRRGAEILADATRPAPVTPVGVGAPAAMPAGAGPGGPRRPVPAPGCGRTPEEILGGAPVPVRLPARLPDLPARPAATTATTTAPGCGRHYVAAPLRTAEQRSRATAAARDRARGGHVDARAAAVVTGARSGPDRLRA